MNKKAISVPILLLALSCAFLTLSSLAYFIIIDSNTGEIIRVSQEIDNVYLEEILLNFYVQDIFDKAVVGFNGDKQAFLDNFRRELLKIKNKNGLYPVDSLALLDLRFQNEDLASNVEVTANSITFRPELIIKQGYSSEDDDISITYTYVKEFAKGF